MSMPSLISRALIPLGAALSLLSMHSHAKDAYQDLVNILTGAAKTVIEPEKPASGTSESSRGGDRSPGVKRPGALPSESTRDIRIAKDSSLPPGLREKVRERVIGYFRDGLCRSGCKDFEVTCHTKFAPGKAERANGITAIHYVGVNWLRNMPPWIEQDDVYMYASVNGKWLEARRSIAAQSMQRQGPGGCPIS